jgi:hypothetical protein
MWILLSRYLAGRSSRVRHIRVQVFSRFLGSTLRNLVKLRGLLLANRIRSHSAPSNERCVAGFHFELFFQETLRQ